MSEQKTCAERFPAQYKQAMHSLWLAYLSSCGESQYIGRVACEDGYEFYYEFEIEEEETVDAYLEGILCFQTPSWKPSSYDPTLLPVQVQFSWGGPADGLIVELDCEMKGIARARYYFQDWYDYAERFMTDEETEWANQVLQEHLEAWLDENEDDLIEMMREWAGDDEEDSEETNESNEPDEEDEDEEDY